MEADFQFEPDHLVALRMRGEADTLESAAAIMEKMSYPILGNILRGHSIQRRKDAGQIG